VASKINTPSGREAGGEALQGRQPAGGVAPAELVLGRAQARVGLARHRGQQDLLDRALERAQRQAFLEQAIGLVLVESGERVGQAGAGGRALAALARRRDR
jgi:hypothetical protein